MVTLTSPQLTHDFCSDFGITEVHAVFNGGQKHVFIVTRNGVKCAVKVFINYGDREIRELNIYREFENAPGIPKILSIEDYKGDKIVFESFIEGDNLDVGFSRYRGDVQFVSKLIADLCNILIPFWTREPSIVHRDIKPSNIIIGKDNKPVILDFGIARDLGETSITQTGYPQPGSWKFASPEQYSGDKLQITYRTDFFSLGALAYFLFYNTLPFGNNPAAIQAAFLNNALPINNDDFCELNTFFLETMKILAAERPRTPQVLLKLLPL